MTTERPTDQLLAEWKALEEAATPGPWTILGRASDSWFIRGPEVPNLESLSGVDEDRSRIAVCQAVWRTTAEADANQAFIAAARTAMPTLLAEVGRLKADVDYLLSRQSGQLKRADALIEERKAALDRLAVLLPVARAAVVLVNSWWQASGEEGPHGEIVTALEQAVVALPADLPAAMLTPEASAELERAMLTEAEMAAYRAAAAAQRQAFHDAGLIADPAACRLLDHIDALTAALAAERAISEDLAGSVQLLAEIEKAQISDGLGGPRGVVKIRNGAVLLYSDMREVANECLSRHRAARQEGG